MASGYQSKFRSTNSRRKGPGFVAKRKIVIKPFGVQPKPPADFEQKSLKRVHEAVATTLKTGNVGSASREEMYRLVESLCIHSRGEVVYSNLHTQCRIHIENTVQQLAAPHTEGIRGKAEAGVLTEAKLDDRFLQRVAKVWADHCHNFAVIRSIFLYLDRTFVLPNPRLTSIVGMGLTLLRTSLTSNSRVLRQITSATLAAIERDRAKSRPADRQLLSKVLGMLRELKIYSSAFEGAFLTSTRRFYETESMQLAITLPLPEYLKHSESRLNEEKGRVGVYIAESTRRQLIGTVEQALIANHVSRLLQRGLEEIVSKNLTEDLARMYSLFERVDGLKPMRAAFLLIIKATGVRLVEAGSADGKTVKGTDPDAKVIPELLKYKKRLDLMVAEAFGGDQDFAYALKQGFEYFVGGADFRVAELLARHVDALLSKGTKGMSEAQASTMLEPSMALFAYVQSKDVFRGYYQRDLGSRLLSGRSASRAAERAMLGKLREACGAAFTKSMEAMFRDMALSDDEGEAFRKAVADSKIAPPKVQLSVRVLTAGSWPELKKTPELTIPEEVKEAQDTFCKFYVSRHKGRRLKWQYPRCSCLLTASFPKAGAKELQVSAYQGAVLLQLSGRDPNLPPQKCPSMADLAKLAGIKAGPDFERTLQALLEAKLILKSPPGRNMLPTDRYIANAGFRSSLFRIKVGMVKATRKRKEKDKRRNVQAQVIADRGLVIDATVVRIMKIRKTLSHQDLFAEVQRRVKFTLTPKMVKKQIEGLLNREYIERDENNLQLYNYKA